MRILLVTCEFPPFKGGAGTLCHDLAIGLSELGVDVTILAAAGGMQALPTVLCGDPARVTLYCMEWGETERWPTLDTTVLERSYDVIICGERLALELVAVNGMSARATVLICHGSEILRYWERRNGDDPAIVRYFVKALFAKAEQVICVSKATQSRLLQAAPELHSHSSVILNGIDFRRLARNTETVPYLEHRLHNKDIILSVGRLDLDKQQDRLLEGYSKIASEFPNSELVIVGDGPERQRLESMACDFGLSERVIFAGRIEDSQLASLLRRCMVFVLVSRSKSRFEGFGLVFLEANYFSIPVVAGNTGGVSEAVEHNRSGLLVDPDDTNEVAQAIARLLRDRGLRDRMGEYGKIRVENKFSSGRMCREYLAVLDKILNSKHDYTDADIRIRVRAGRRTIVTLLIRFEERIWRLREFFRRVRGRVFLK